MSFTLFLITGGWNEKALAQTGARQCERGVIKVYFEHFESACIRFDNRMTAQYL